jgi:hypothetical protein
MNRNWCCWRTLTVTWKKFLLMTTNIKLWNRITKPFWLNNVEYFPEIQWILNGSHWQNWAVLDDSTSHIPLKSGSGAAFCTSLPCSSLHWVQLEDSPRFTGIKPKWSTSKSQLPKFRNAKPMCSPLWPVVAQNFNTSEAEELIFDVFQAKSPSSAVHSGFLRPPKEMLPTKSSPPHSLRKWWEIYRATPCADCTIDTTKSSRPHPFEKLGVICGLSHAFPEQHSYDEGNIIQIIHIIHIIHSYHPNHPLKPYPSISSLSSIPHLWIHQEKHPRFAELVWLSAMGNWQRENPGLVNIQKANWNMAIEIVEREPLLYFHVDFPVRYVNVFHVLLFFNRNRW